jgi:hypothetical protein
VHPIFKNVTSEVITGSIVHKENQFIDFDVERLIPKMLSTEGPCIAVGDINNDGTEDFFIGSSVGDTARIFIQQKNGHFREQSQASCVTDKYFRNNGCSFF